jgi:hypothetical protein
MSPLTQYRIEILGCDSICFVPIEQKYSDRKIKALDVSKISLDCLLNPSNNENEKIKA